MKSNQLKWGAVLSYLSMGLNILIGLAYTPIMIRILGQSEYGLYNTVSSTISMLSILSLGFNSSYVRYLAKYKQQHDSTKIYKLNGLFLLIFAFIGVVALICGTYLMFHLDIIFKNGLTQDEYATARVLVALLVINLATSFPLSVFSSIISANERFIFQKLLGMITTVLGPAVTLPLLLMGYRSIAMVSVSLIMSILSGIINVYYVIFYLHNKFIFHDFEPGIFKSLFTYTIFIAINLVIDQINWNIDKILLGRYKGTAAVAIYSVGYSLYGYYMTFSLSISNVFTPRIHKIVNETRNNLTEQKKQLTSLFITVGRIQFLILALVASGVFFFGKEFIVNIWAGPEYSESYYVALLLIFPASIPLIQNLGIEIQRAQNLHSFRSFAYSGMAILNLLMSIDLCQRYGAVGSVLGTAVSLLLANGLIMNIFYHKKCNIDILAFWKNIIQMSSGLIIPVISGFIIKYFFDCNKLTVYILGIIFYTVIYTLSMWCMGLNKSEKSFITGLKSRKIALKS